MIVEAPFVAPDGIMTRTLPVDDTEYVLTVAPLSIKELIAPRFAPLKVTIVPALALNAAVVIVGDTLPLSTVNVPLTRVPPGVVTAKVFAPDTAPAGMATTIVEFDSALNGTATLVLPIVTFVAAPRLVPVRSTAAPRAPEVEPSVIAPGVVFVAE